MSDPRPIVIVCAPQGAGKTLHAQAIAGRFGCNVIVDEWDGASELAPGTLALTNLPPRELAIPTDTSESHERVAA